MRNLLTITAVTLVFASCIAFSSACSTGASAIENNVSAADSMPMPTPVTSASDEVFDGQKIEKSDEEWKKQLTPAAFYVLRQEGTERAYTGQYDKHKEKGDYHCAACNLKLFSSRVKFDSGTGWPSFFQPINKKNVAEKKDGALGMERIEVECSRCGSHLGHVFDDGPEPTGLRYCINSVSLRFEKAK